jgi:hypothetical protein
MAENKRWNPILIALAVFLAIAAAWIIFGIVVGARAS